MDFTAVAKIALKKPKAIKCSYHCTISPIVHTANIVARILRRRKKELGMQLGCQE